jgi:hypothetical protein
MQEFTLQEEHEKALGLPVTVITAPPSSNQGMFINMLLLPFFNEVAHFTPAISQGGWLSSLLVNRSRWAQLSSDAQQQDAAAAAAAVEASETAAAAHSASIAGSSSSDTAAAAAAVAAAAAAQEQADAVKKQRYALKHIRDGDAVLLENGEEDRSKSDAPEQRLSASFSTEQPVRRRNSGSKLESWNPLKRWSVDKK